MTDARHRLGLLLGTENDWPRVFEGIVSRLGPVTDGSGNKHSYDVERITIEPFDLRDTPSYDLVIDRLAYWYYHPREWLKKVALMDGVYLLNSPFAFQAMEKHAAYCAMMRLGLKVPATALVPYKNPVDHAKYAFTAERYNRAFDLDAVADKIGYPLFMKPYDGGAWVGVSRIRDRAELHRAYDESGEMLMHLQASVEGYDVFARSLSIGAETMVMNFDPEQPMHARYSVSHDFLSPEIGAEVLTIGRVVNAFFRWEFNSCETLVRGEDVHPIDYANACPDVAITSLHYYFPWAMKALVKWAVFCTATGRRARPHVDPAPWFEVAERDDLSYAEKLADYRALADDYFDTERYQDFCASRLGEIDELVLA
ncbi:MAG: ATP-grasp domain-containing protein, partial [Actinomycetes bacterium]